MRLPVVLHVVDVEHGLGVAGGAGGVGRRGGAVLAVVLVADELVRGVGHGGGGGRLPDPGGGGGQVLALGGADGVGGRLGLGVGEGFAEEVADGGGGGVRLPVVLHVVEINNMAVAINC